MAAPDKTDQTPEKRWMAPFLSKFAETGIVAIAARYAKIGRDTVYRYKRDDPEFAARYADAEKQAVVVLEDVATKRAIEKSDTMLIFLLKCRDREKYGDRAETVHSGAITVGTMNLDNADEGDLRERLARAAATLLPGGPDPLREG